MVPYRHTADLVLLPYEKHLIDALGCTEAEYKEFVRHLQHKATARPPNMTWCRIYMAGLLLFLF